MSEFKNFNGYAVKDEIARKSIEDLLNTHNDYVETNNTSMNTLKTELEKSIDKANELAEAINEVSTDYIKVIISGIRRKLISITGTLKLWYKKISELEKENICSISLVETEYFKIKCRSSDGVAREITINNTEGVAKYLEITQMNGYAFKRGSVYSTSGTDKTIIGLNIDDVEYDSIEVLRDTSFTFKRMILSYTVPISDTDSTLCNVTLMVSAKGVNIIETVPEGKSSSLTSDFITGNSSSYFTHVQEHNGVCIFKISSSGSKTFVERVENLVGTVIKKFTFDGGL